MKDALENTPPEPDPELVEAMRSRVVRRKPQSYGNRKAGPGRPKGSTKTGGRKAGAPNLMSPEFRQWLAEKAKPFEVLAAICAGEEIEDAGKKRKPTIPERMRAAETIARKLVPDLAATALTGENGGPVSVTQSGGASELSDFEVARRLAFLLAKGIHDAQESGARPATLPRSPVPIPSPVPAPAQIDAPLRDSVTVGALTVSFAEQVGERERWTVSDQNGRVVGAAFGRDTAIDKARTHGKGDAA